jgi:hypothetical protein
MKQAVMTDKEAFENGRKTQLSFFWFGDPKLVIALIQFMQFGYALALAILLVYWKDVDHPIDPSYYLGAVLICYYIFIRVMARVIPRYTLCTSLGYLVNERHLQETVAEFRLEEAQRRRLRILAERSVYADHDGGSVVIIGPHSDRDLATETPRPSSIENKETSVTFGSSLPPTTIRLSAPRDRGEETKTKMNAPKTQLLAELVRMDTVNLRQAVPKALPKGKKTREQMMQERRNRRKSVSDGVALMRAVGSSKSTAAEDALLGMDDAAPASSPTPTQTQDDSALVKRELPTRRERRRNKSVSASAVIQSWQDFAVTDSDSMALTRAADVARMQKRSQSTVLARPPRSRQGTPQSGGLHPLVEVVSEELVEVASPGPESERTASLLPGTNAMSANANTDDGDDHTIDTCKSVGGRSIGELSDVSIDVLESERSAYIGSLHGKPTGNDSWSHVLSPPVLKERLRKYLTGKRYVSIDHVIGTLFCFYLVGSRVEILLHGSNIVPAGDQSIVLKSHYSFWAEIVWFFAFLAGAVSIILLVPKSMQHDNSKVKALVVSAWLDIFITGSCLAFLLVAESQRCCEEDEKDSNYNYYKGYYDPLRNLAVEGVILGGGYDAYGSWYDKLEDCCPMWGRRGYGGVGNIEPFTGLIVLRVIRFSVSKFIVRHLDERSAKKKSTDTPTDEADGEKSPIREMLFKENHLAMKDEKGTALELWERAVRKYPGIVAKYGEFSGELFQAMLGLPIIDEDKPAPAYDSKFGAHEDITLQEEATQTTQATESTWSQRPERPKMHKRSQSIGQSFRLAGKQYENLPIGAQEIILAGKLGMPVCCETTRNLEGIMADKDLPALHEHEELHHHNEKPVGPTQFSVDAAQLAREANLEQYGFIAPNAPLVRSMRRCDRRLVPLLTKWVPVDVAVTKFEIVYFEAEDVEDGDFSDTTKAATRTAMTATKGGNGLRLCDVAVGRKVVGHLALSEITELHVERSMPVVDLSLLKDIDDVSGNSTLKSEYWSEDTTKQKTEASETNCSRNARWAKVKEDRLKLTSIHGTLVLRFYSDLEDTESHLEQSTKEFEAEGPLRKNISFQWVQTISRFCGLDQLRQSLPHFGDNTCEELRDFLVVVDYHDKEAGEAKKKSHNRRKSSISMQGIPLEEMQTSPQSNSRKAFHRSSRSFGGEALGRKAFHRSTHSFGGETEARARAGSIDGSDLKKSFDFSVLTSAPIEEEEVQFQKSDEEPLKHGQDVV